MRSVAAPLLSCLLPGGASGQLGPGAGPWRTATPESQGLSAEALARAEEAVNAAVGERVCFVVVKNGVIVHETYRRGWTVSSTRPGFSTTKGSCAALYGIAVQQGWARVHDSVAARNGDRGTRTCNPAAEFRHVLTMTGESPDLSHPTFRYGNGCLETLSDFFTDNNPGGLSMEAFKDRYWQEPLGMEHMSWTTPSCGTGAIPGHNTQHISCRDLARSAQLFANDGAWPGAGQVVSREFAVASRRWIFPGSGMEYGYTMWLRVDDPVDPRMNLMGGARAQCGIMSPEHDAVIVSMGDNIDGCSCGGVWERARHAVVSRDHPRYNATRALAAGAAAAAGRCRPDRAEVVDARDHYRNRTSDLPPAELRLLNAQLREWGEQEIA